MHVAIKVALDLARDTCGDARVFDQVETLPQRRERVRRLGNVEELHR